MASEIGVSMGKDNPWTGGALRAEYSGVVLIRIVQEC